MHDLNLTGDTFKELDSDRDGKISQDGFQRIQADKQVFDDFDLDHSGLLETPEIENCLRRAGLSPNDFDWKPFDADKDGKYTMLEFLSAGPAVGEAAHAQASALMEEEEEPEDDTDDDDKDEDLENFALEADDGEDVEETPALLEEDDNAEGEEDMSLYDMGGEEDDDGDDKESLLQEDEDSDKESEDDEAELDDLSLLEEDTEEGKDEDEEDGEFEDHEDDGDDANSFLEDDDFEDHEDGEDGEDGHKGGDEKLLHGTDEIIFKRMDGNNDSMIEADDMEGPWRQAMGLKFDNLPPAFDKNHDQKLSFDEFKKLCEHISLNHPRKVNQIKKAFSLLEGSQDERSLLRSSRSLLSGRGSEEDDDEEGDDEDDEGEEGYDDHNEGDHDDETLDSDAEKEMMHKHFVNVDENKSGLLEEEEIKKLLANMNMNGFDWSSLDTNKDGKLSEEEFAAAIE